MAKTVEINGRVRDNVSDTMANNILNVGKMSVRLGVYAIEKDDLIVMLKLKAPNKKILKSWIEKYNKNGFKVYYNG